MKIDLGAGVKSKKLIMIIAIISAIVVVSAAIALTIYFVESAKAYITYMNDDKISIVAVDSKLPERLSPGKQIKFTVDCHDGYEVDYVKVNDDKLSPDENGVYVVTIEKDNKSVNIIAKSKSATFVALNYSGTLSKTIQFDGDVFNPDGLTFTRLFSNGTSMDITPSMLELPVLGVNKSVIVSYAGRSVIIEGVTVVNTTTFDLVGMGTFNATDSSIYKTRYNPGEQIVYPTSEDFSVKNGKKTGALVGWNLYQVTDSGNHIYRPEWNYFSDYNVTIDVDGEKASMLVTADILVSKDTSKIKIVIGDKEFIPEIMGNSIKKEILFEELNENVSINSAGYKVNLFYNESGYVTVNASIERSFYSGKYYYSVSTNEAGEFLVKKVLVSDFVITGSNLYFSGNNLKFDVEIYDLITGEPKDLDSTVRAKVFIGEYEINAIVNLGHFVQATLPLSDFIEDNGLVPDTNYLLQVGLEFNGIPYTRFILAGETDLNTIFEDGDYYYSFVKDENDKLYLVQKVIPVPQLEITSVEVQDKTLTVKGNADSVKIARIRASYNGLAIYGESISDVDGEFTLEFNLSDLSSNDNPVYDFMIILNESQKYSVNIPYLFQDNVTIESILTEYEKLVYTFINNEDNLSVSVETVATTPQFNISGVQVVQDTETNDYSLIVSGTCSNINQLVLSYSNVTSQADIIDGEFVLSYDLSRLGEITSLQTFSLIINNSNDYPMDFPEGFGIKDVYAFVSGDQKITYEFKNESGLFVLNKYITDVENSFYTITDITVNTDLILTINGKMDNVSSAYVALDYGTGEVYGSQGVDTQVELYSFSTSIDLKTIMPDSQTSYSVYIYVNEIKKSIENIYFIDNQYIYQSEGYTYTYTFNNTDDVSFVVTREEVLLPVIQFSDIDMQGNLLILSGTYTNIDSFNVDIYDGEISILSGVPTLTEGNFEVRIDIFNLPENSYIVKLVYGGEVHDIIGEFDKKFTMEYNSESKKVFSVTGNNTLTLTVSYEQKVFASIEITSADIYKDNGEIYLSVSGNSTNIEQLYMVFFESQSDIITTSGEFNIVMNITEMPDNQYVYFNIRYVEADGNIEETMFIEISDSIIESKIYEFYGNENTLYSYEVNAQETNNYLAIKLTISTYEQSYSVTSVTINEETQILTVEGTVAGIDSVNIRIGSVTGENATIESNNFVATIDLSKISADNMKQNVLLCINNNPENITGIVMEKEEYVSEYEKAVYTVTVTYGFQGEIIIQRDADTSEVADFLITNAQFSQKDIIVSGEYNGEGEVHIALVDEQGNIYNTDIATQVEGNSFTSIFSAENLAYNHTYLLKLYVAVQEYYYTVRFESQIESVTEEYEYDQDNRLVYIFEKTDRDSITIKVTKVLNYNKSVTINSITLDTYNDSPFMIITGTTENVETISLVSDNFGITDAVITDGVFTLYFPLAEITEEGDYTFRIYFDNIMLDFASGEQTLDFAVSETLINTYSFTNQTNLIELNYVQQQIFVESIDIQQVTISNGSLNILANVQNVDRMELVIDSLAGTVLNNPQGDVTLSFDLSNIILDGTYNININTNINTYNLQFRLNQPIVYSYEQNNMIYTFTVKNTVSDKVVIEYSVEEKIVYYINVVSAYIDFENNKQDLCFEINTNVKRAYIMAGDYAGDYYTINESNHIVVFNLKSVNLINTALSLTINSDDLSINVINDNLFTVPESYYYMNGENIITYTFNQNNKNELYVIFTAEEIPQPTLSDMEISFAHDLSVEVTLTGKYQDVSSVILNLYSDGELKDIIYALLEQGRFTVTLDLSQYLSGNYDIELECINDFVTTKEFINYNDITFTPFNYTENNIKYSYTINNVSSKGVLSIDIEYLPVLEFTNIYLVYAGKPYIYFEGNKQNINTLVVSSGNLVAETVDESGALFVLRIDLSGVEEDTALDFDYTINSQSTGKIDNTVITTDTITYTVDNYRYTVSVDRVENSDTLYIIKEKEEIINSYSIDTVYVQKVGDDYILTLEGTYQGEDNVINMYAVTEYSRMSSDYTISGGQMKFEFNLNQLSFYEESARFVVKFNGTDYNIDYSYFDSETTAYDMSIYGMMNHFEFSDDNGLIVTITQI